MACSQGRCQNPCEWKPVLELRTKKSDPPTRLRFKTLGYCTEHKSGLVLSNFLSDEGFVKIAKFMRENGKPSPVQKITSLAFEALTKEEIKTLEPLIAQNQPADSSLPF